MRFYLLKNNGISIKELRSLRDSFGPPMGLK